MNNKIMNVIWVLIVLCLVVNSIEIKATNEHEYKKLSTEYNTIQTEYQNVCMAHTNLTNANKELQIKYANLQKQFNNLNIKYKKINKKYKAKQRQEKKKVKQILQYIKPLKRFNKIEYLKAYKKILNNYKDLSIKTVYDVYSSDEIAIMWRCIETEVYQKSFNCKVNVANVILNRVKSKKFPNDPIAVVTAKNQFAYHRKKISKTTKLALEYAFLFGDTTNGSVSFRSDIKPSKWHEWEYQFSDSVHAFYK